MTSPPPAPRHQAGLTAALAVVRLVMALLERLFADVADLPRTHPDRRAHDRLVAMLARTEARILAEIAATAQVEARPCRPECAHFTPQPMIAPRPSGATHPFRPAHASRAPPGLHLARHEGPLRRGFSRGYLVTLS